jgi:hypothetical protein
VTFAVGIMCGEGVVLAADTLHEILRNENTATPGTGDFVPGQSKIREIPGGLITGCGIGQLLDAVDDLLTTLPVVEPGVIHYSIREFKSRYPAPRSLVDRTTWMYSYEGRCTCSPGVEKMVKDLGIDVALFRDDGSVAPALVPTYGVWPHGTPDPLLNQAGDYLGQYGCHGAHLGQIGDAVVEVFRALQLPGVAISDDLYVGTHAPGHRKRVEHISVSGSIG